MTRRLKLPDADYLKEVFRYDPETGELSFAEPVPFRRKPGPINRLSTQGYKTVCLYGITYYQHRVIWKMVTGDEPVYLDHINQDKADNRLANLRPVSAVENAWNAKQRSHNTSGFRGVTYRREYKVWRAIIKYDGKRHEIGAFSSKEEAIAAYEAKAVEVSRGFYKPVVLLPSSEGRAA